MPEMRIDQLRDEVERLEKVTAELIYVLLNIRMMAWSKEPAEELADAQRDLRCIYMLSYDALNFAATLSRAKGET